MSAATLEVFEQVPIPVDYAAIQKYVTLGASDSGKTVLLARFAEQLAKAEGFWVLLDPVGKHWSLRAGPDGTPEGGIENVWVLGGLHGDVPLDPASGALIADTIVDHPGRYVIDTSAFETDKEVYNFATAFARRLFRRKMRDAGWPMILMIEEAETFLPQVPPKDGQDMKSAFGRIVRQGRNHGLGVFLVFQRSAAGDKGAISQCKILIAKRTSHNLDQTAISDWAKTNGSPEQIGEMMDALASMGVDEAFIWDPSWLKVFARTHVFMRDTFDSSANVKHGAKMEKVELTALPIEELGAKMKALAEEAAENDPVKLHERIAELEADLSRDQGALEDVAAAEEAVREAQERITQLEQQVAELEQRPAEPVIVEVPVVEDESLQVIESLRDDLAGAHSEVANLIERIVEMRSEKSSAPPPVVHPPVAPAPAPPAPAPAPGPNESARSRSQNGELTKAQRELVEAYVAFFPRSASPEQLGIMLAKSSNAGPFRGAITAVREMGYVDEAGRATEQGRALVGSSSLPSPDHVQQRWRSRLSGTKLRIFETVLAAYPRTVTPEEIGQAIGKNPNAGPIRGMMNDLAAWQLVTYDKDAGVRVSDYLVDLTGAGS